MTEKKRPTLSLPNKPAGEKTSSTGRSRPPVRGSNMPRAPKPFASKPRDGEESPRRGFGGRTEREGQGNRRDFGDRPREDRPRREFADRNDRPERSGPRDDFRSDERRRFEDRPRREFGDRSDRPQRSGPRDNFRPDDRRRFEDRPRRTNNEGHGEDRPRRSFSDERRSFEDRPRREFGGQDRRPPREGGRSFEERKPFGDRPRRDDRGNENRGNDQRRNFSDRPRRPEGEFRPDDRPRRNFGDDRPRFEDRPRREFSDADRRPPREGGRGFEERRSFGERPRRDERNDNRSNDERRSYADRPRREEENRGFGERRSFGERPNRSFEDRPRRSFGNDDFRPQRDRRESDDSRGSFNRNRDEAESAAPRGTSFSRGRPSENAAPRRREEVREAEQRPASTNLEQDPEGSMRLSKRMAELGLCSRREADEYIERGLVKVDGVVVDELGSKVLPDQKIELSVVAENIQMRRITVLINKPIGYVSGQAEDGYEPASVLITPENHWEEDPTKRRFESRIIRKLAPAGRLDIDSTGLLVLTQDGRVAKHLIGEASEVEKEYLVRVEGSLSAKGMQMLNHGLDLDGVELQPAKVSWQNEDQLRFVLREGRKRQIRRMCELVGLKVVGLKRIRIGRVKLGKLPPGQWRYLAEGEEF